MNWKGYGRNRSWPNVVRIASRGAETGTRDHSNTKQEGPATLPRLPLSALYGSPEVSTVFTGAPTGACLEPV
jgi:hypothetical protein